MQFSFRKIIIKIGAAFYTVNFPSLPCSNQINVNSQMKLNNTKNNFKEISVMKQIV